jgi:Transposase DNA-binding
MNTQDFLDPHRWAEATFGGVLLKDMRRTRRAVMAAEHMAENASASLPAQMQKRREIKALYRLLNEPDVTFAELMRPHWDQTLSWLLRISVRKSEGLCQEVPLLPLP